MCHPYIESATTFSDIIKCLPNPLSPVDAYLRQIIECAKGPLMHICVKHEGIRFNCSFGSCK